MLLSVEQLLAIDRGHIRKPNVKRRGLKSAERACEYVTAITELISVIEPNEDDEDVRRTKRVRTGKTRPCMHRSFLYQVNHLKLSLCICHARQLSNKKRVKVKAL